MPSGWPAVGPGMKVNAFLLPPGFPDADTSTMRSLAQAVALAQAVLGARATHERATLADMYVRP